MEKALLFTGLLYSKESVYTDVRPLLFERFGTLLLESPEVQWSYSDYYKDELGWPIKRRFIIFNSLVEPDKISDIKLFTINMEKGFSDETGRNINIDPGYLTSAKIVLPTTKNYAHRIYLKDGIFAEVTLLYKNGSFRPHIFTYSDYREQETIDFFKKGRDFLKEM